MTGFLHRLAAAALGHPLPGAALPALPPRFLRSVPEASVLAAAAALSEAPPLAPRPAAADPRPTVAEPAQPQSVPDLPAVATAGPATPFSLPRQPVRAESTERAEPAAPRLAAHPETNRPIPAHLRQEHAPPPPGPGQPQREPEGRRPPPEPQCPRPLSDSVVAFRAATAAQEPVAVVQVTIDRIEVRLPAPPPDTTQPPALPRRVRPASTSLADFLRGTRP